MLLATLGVARAGAQFRLSINAGGNATLTPDRGMAVLVPGVSVQVSFPDGRPAPGVTVYATCLPVGGRPSCAFNNAGATTVSAVTSGTNVNPSGVAWFSTYGGAAFRALVTGKIPVRFHLVSTYTEDPNLSIDPNIVVRDMRALTLYPGDPALRLSRVGSPATASVPLVTVMAVDSMSAPAVGRTVTFECGTLSPGMTCAPSGTVTTTTDNSGYAYLRGATIGGADGNGSFIARSAGFSPLTIPFTVVPSAANVPLLTPLGGNGQRIPFGVDGTATVVTPLSVQVRTNTGAALAGVPVTFTCGSGSNVTSCFFRGIAGQRTATVVSGPDGVATLASATVGGPVVTLRGTVGSAGVSASATGGNTAAFDILMLALSPTEQVATLTIASPNPIATQRSSNGNPNALTATVGGLTVVARDASGLPVAGAQIAFRCGSLAPGMTCSVDPSGTATVVTNASGSATLAQAIFGGADGAGSVTASAGRGSATFGVTLMPVMQTPVRDVTASSGAGQRASRLPLASPAAVATFQPVGVIVRDMNGLPAPNVPTTFQCQPAVGMTCAIGSGTSVTVNTNMSGIATTPAAVTASGADGTLTLQVTAGRVVTAIPLQVTPGNLTVMSGANQTILRSTGAAPNLTGRFAALSVKATDGQGVAQAGVPVLFSCTSAVSTMRCVFDGGANTATVPTDATGVAIATPSITADGGLTVTATLGALTASFPLTVEPNPTLVVQSGNLQRAAVQSNGRGGPPNAAFGPLAALLRDADGRPMAGQTVSWTCAAPAGGSCSLGAASTVTAATGIATINYVNALNVAGVYTVTAVWRSPTGRAVSVQFTLNANCATGGRGGATSC